MSEHLPPSKRQPETVAAQGLHLPDSPYGDVVNPIHMATTFIRAADGSYPRGRVYGRDQSPAYDDPEGVLAHLEGGRECLLFGSGLAASASFLQALQPGDRVLLPRAVYWGFRAWAQEIGARWGLLIDTYDNSDLDSLAAALARAPTRVVWIETPANPTWEVTDIAGAASLARQHDALAVVDSTVSSPVLTRPLALGAHLVMHSATKYLNGHSDVLAGALVCGHDLPEDLWLRVRQIRGLGGAILGPFEAWLLARGMRTLFVRVRAACSGAALIAQGLAAHPAVEAVRYPGLPEHPGHAVAARQMEGGFGGMLSFEVRGGEAAAIATAARVELWRRATSLGAVESLIEHRASVEGPASLSPRNLLRLSVGIESPADLLADLIQALEGATRSVR